MLVDDVMHSKADLQLEDGTALVDDDDGDDDDDDDDIDGDWDEVHCCDCGITSIIMVVAVALYFMLGLVFYTQHPETQWSASKQIRAQPT